eukprot:Pompholyxophrys_punicea_v1_NODE_1080_length_980_cov_2.245405.p2 type:complete len:120 gc:universal NODE_1080_length_980_cov_2.245405:872-513(-)
MRFHRKRNVKHKSTILRTILSKPTNKAALKFVSNLHAYTRCLEYVLNVGIRLKMGFQSWRIPKIRKEQAKEKEKEIQNELRKKMGIIVNMVKQGFGLTNDGNTARRFFADPHCCGVHKF